jgi:hypothetical protein
MSGLTIEAPRNAAHDEPALALILAWWRVETRHHPATLGVDKRPI